MPNHKHFAVIGLGSFGTALAARLAKNGCRVTGVDSQPERVDVLKQDLYEAVIGDATERETLRQISIGDFQAVFVSLGEDITPSLLAVLHAKELGARRIVVKGVTQEHGKLLKHLGVERVIFPEIEVAETLADRMTWPNIIDFLPIDPNYTIVEVAVPDSMRGRTLQQINLRRKYGVWVLGVKNALTGHLEMFPDADFELGLDQILLAIGQQDELSRLQGLK